MDSFDKKIKEIYSEDPSGIPEGMSWDEMQDGIAAKMPKKRKRRFPFFIILACLGIGAAGFALNHYTRTDATNLTELDIKNENLSDRLESSSNTNQKLASSTEITLTKDELLAKNQVAISSETKRLSNDKSISSKANLVPEQNEKQNILPNATKRIKEIEGKNKSHSADSAYSSSVLSSPSDQDDTFDEIVLENDLIGGQSEVIAENKATSTAKQGETSDFQHEEFYTTELQARPIILLSSSNVAHLAASITSRKPSKMSIGDDTKVISSGQQLTLTSGLLLWKWGVKAQNKHNIGDFETELNSYTIQLFYSRKIAKKWGVESGLIYNSLYSKFENQFFTIDTVYKTGIEQPVYNLVTRKTSLITGDGNVEVSTNRFVRHYNTYHNFQLPILVYRQFEFSKLTAKIGLGTAINVYTHATGRSIDHNGLLLDYDTSATNIRSFGGFNALGKLELAYAIRKKLSLSSSLQYQQALSNWTLRQDDIRMPSSFSISLGLRYNLN